MQFNQIVSILVFLLLFFFSFFIANPHNVFIEGKNECIFISLVVVIIFVHFIYRATTFYSFLPNAILFCRLFWFPSRVLPLHELDSFCFRFRFRFFLLCAKPDQKKTKKNKMLQNVIAETINAVSQPHLIYLHCNCTIIKYIIKPFYLPTW